MDLKIYISGSIDVTLESRVYATQRLTLAGRPLALKKDSSSRFPEILKQADLKEDRETGGKSDFRLMDSANMFSAGLNAPAYN